MWLKKNLNLLVIIGACIIVFTFFNKKEDYVEEYNAKIKAFRAQFRGVRKVDFFLFRWIKSKCCGEILNLDICILKFNTNARFFCRPSQVVTS